MPLAKETRNLMAKTVAACRRRLAEDAGGQLRGVIGLHPDGVVLPLEKPTHLSPGQHAAARRVHEVFDLLWKDKAHELEQEACTTLGVSDLRDYFRKPEGFFQGHLYFQASQPLLG